MSISVGVPTPLLEKPKKIVVIVNKVEKSYNEVNKVIESRMVKAFSKMLFIKPKPHEVECDSINLIYECFGIVNMKYHLEYYRNNNYILNIEDNVVNSTIFNQIVQPQIIQGKSKKLKQLKLEAKEYVVEDVLKNLAFDRKGRKINPKNIPSSKTEPDPIEFLDSYETNVKHLEISIPEILKKSINERPTDIDELIDERFEIISQVLIYTPIFEGRVRNLKSQEIKIIPVCGVTGKIFSV